MGPVVLIDSSIHQQQRGLESAALSRVEVSAIYRHLGPIADRITEITHFKETIRNFSATQGIAFNETATNKLLEVMGSCIDDPSRISALPNLLFNFRQSIPTKVQPSISTTTKAVLARGDALVGEVVLQLARAALEVNGLTDHQGSLIPLAQGGHNWAFSNLKDLVVLVSKGRIANPIETYYLRNWCLNQLSALGLPDAQIFSIGKAPITHLIGSLIPGEQLGNLLWSAQISDGSHRDVDKALAGLGNFLAQLRGVTCQGVGPLTLASDGFSFSGKYRSWSEYIHSHTEHVLELSSVILEHGLLSTAQLRKLCDSADALSEIHLPTYLVMADPNRNNFFVSSDLESFWTTDWDGSLASNDIEMVGRLYMSWVERGTVYKTVDERRKLFTQIIEKLIDNESEREDFVSKALSWVALYKLREASEALKALLVSTSKNELVIPKGVVKEFQGIGAMVDSQNGTPR